MKHHKNRAKSITSHDNLVFEDEIHRLADAIIEKDDKTPSLVDPFEDYVDKVKHKFQSNPHIFRSRLVRGYNALLRELE